MERAEHDAADQFQIILGQGRPKDRRVFGHKANRPQLDPLIARARAIGQNLSPSGVARVVCKFDAPRTGRIADTDGHRILMLWGRRASRRRQML